MLAHTKTEFGAKNLDCEIHFFKQAVAFSGNDKARVIIMFSAIDNESHLKLLNDLLTIFSNGTAIENIMACTTKIEILDYYFKFSRHVYYMERKCAEILPNLYNKFLYSYDDLFS